MQEKGKTEITMVDKLVIIFILMLIIILMGYLEQIIEEKFGSYAMLYTAALYASLAAAILIYAEWDKENEARKRKLNKGD